MSTIALPSSKMGDVENPPLHLDALPDSLETSALYFVIQNGPLTVNEFWNRSWLKGQQGNFSSAVHLLQSLRKKGLIKLESTGRFHRYVAAITREQFQQMATHFLRSVVFCGDEEEFAEMVEMAAKDHSMSQDAS